MRESRPYGSVRGARGNSRPYRYHAGMGIPASDTLQEQTRLRPLRTSQMCQIQTLLTHRTSLVSQFLLRRIGLQAMAASTLLAVRARLQVWLPIHKPR
jgi:hypothetical protein